VKHVYTAEAGESLVTAENSYVGKHIEPENIVVLPEYRLKGLGKKLMA